MRNKFKTTTCKCGHVFGICALLDISWVTACDRCNEKESTEKEQLKTNFEQEVRK